MQWHLKNNVTEASMRRSLFLFFLFAHVVSSAQFNFSGWDVGTFDGGRRDDGSAFSLQGTGYFGCGIDQYYQLRNDWWMLDTVEGTWVRTSDLPGRPRQYATVLTTSDHAYLIAGITDSAGYSNEVFRFDPLGQQWAQLPDAPFSPRAAGAGFRIGEYIFFGTGRNDSTQFNDFWRYDPYYQRWEMLDSLPFAGRDEMVGFSALGYGYLLLGRDSLHMHHDVWRYDPQTGEWIEQAAFPGAARSYATAVSEPGGAVVAGGTTESDSLLSEAYHFSATTGKWTRLDDLPVSRVRGMEGFRLANRIYLCGGLSVAFTRIDQVQQLSFSFEEIQPIVKVWPVPARDQLRAYIEVDHYFSGATLEVFNIRGEQLFETLFSSDQLFFEIPLLEFQDGIYYMKMIVGEESYLRTFVVMK